MFVAIPKITVRATFDIVRFDDTDDPDGYTEEQGWCEPTNPWGSMHHDEPVILSFDSAWEAAEFILNFPGGVWDYEDTYHETNMVTGADESVTLHVDQPWVFELCDTIRNNKLG